MLDAVKTALRVGVGVGLMALVIEVRWARKQHLFAELVGSRRT